jgi:hypothetical protein
MFLNLVCLIVLTPLSTIFPLYRGAGRWFSPGPPVSSTNKTDHHDIAEILLKAAGSAKFVNFQLVDPFVCCFFFSFFF